jgi:hypothetical protein
MIGHQLRSNSAFSKWLPKHGIKKWAVRIQHCPISSKFDMWVDAETFIWGCRRGGAPKT